LAEAVGDDCFAAAAAVLSERGIHPLIGDRHPEFASQLAALGIPPRVQLALMRGGFDSFDRVCEAVSSMSAPSVWAEQLGLPLAAEVLLIRLWHSASDAQKLRSGKEQKRPWCTSNDVQLVEAEATARTPKTSEDVSMLSAFSRKVPVKKLRLSRQGAAEAIARELVAESWQLRGDAQMQEVEDDDIAEGCDDRASDSEELNRAAD
jgi:hypothetical protein